MTAHFTSTRDPQLRMISFGFGHALAPAADLVLDLRKWFRDPGVFPRLRAMTGRDHEVIENVLNTAGAVAFIDTVFGAVTELVRLGLRTVTPAAGCRGGRHRGVVVADQLVLRARSSAWTADVAHRDISRLVLTSQRTTARTSLSKQQPGRCAPERAVIGAAHDRGQRVGRSCGRAVRASRVPRRRP